MATHEARDPDAAPLMRRRRRRVVWTLAALALPPAAWFGHLSVSYWLVPVTCRWSSVVPLHVATVTALAAAVAVTVGAARRLRDQRRPWWMILTATSSEHETDRPDEAEDTERSSSTIAAVVAMAFGAYFAFVIVMAGLIAIIVDPCG